MILKIVKIVIVHYLITKITVKMLHYNIHYLKKNESIQEVYINNHI